MGRLFLFRREASSGGSGLRLAGVSVRELRDSLLPAVAEILKGFAELMAKIIAWLGSKEDPQSGTDGDTRAEDTEHGEENFGGGAFGLKAHAVEDILNAGVVAIADISIGFGDELFPIHGCAPYVKEGERFWCGDGMAGRPVEGLLIADRNIVATLGGGKLSDLGRHGRDGHNS